MMRDAAGQLLVVGLVSAAIALSWALRPAPVPDAERGPLGHDPRMRVSEGPSDSTTLQDLVAAAQAPTSTILETITARDDPRSPGAWYEGSSRETTEPEEPFDRPGPRVVEDEPPTAAPPFQPAVPRQATLANDTHNEKRTWYFGFWH